ncbi:MAG: nitroreductase family protein, partial [Spirochaetota bacterium]
STAGDYAVPLECVRLSPSASNNQPWRVFKEKDRNTFHFYLKRTKGYDKVNSEIQLQEIDMGIAMAHFELSARETGISGEWNTIEPAMFFEDMEYIVSWKGE